jgi:hypothetical protein
LEKDRVQFGRKGGESLMGKTGGESKINPMLEEVLPPW